MAPLPAETALRRLIESELPAVKTAGCRFSPVQGLTGESWRIDGEGVQLLARQQSAEKTALGVSRRREARVLRRAGEGLGPQVLAQNNQWIILEWLAGDVVTEARFTRLNQHGELARWVTRLHRRPLSGYPLNLHNQFARYWQQLDRRRLTPAWLRLHQRFLQARLPSPLKIAPLHMDIHPGNLIAQGEGVRLIDWEYAADGDIALEIAALFRSNAWSAANQQHFLQHYSQQGYNDLPLLSTQVQRWLPWVDYLMLLWFEVRWQQTGDSEFLRWGAVQRRRFCLSSPCSE
ncbi:thiamine kinase [Serratia plymuthica]|uniref:Thiamine kinase n=1 Tax=Serratia plymuthica TaxID=82996 RepID=A0A318PHV2_SERPL|nr:thiamine kinase [Serratia plymuthica]AGO54732.1 thiamine kinase ThiK [Serratia plymuthica 4Rx13]MEB6537661.1 thiamine kinase [Serratia plymuthica]PYD39097.1 thiamine kinase [Serratia plymuthica]